ncbi:MAG: DUF3341 domain-containing protein [Deltaproteobacteria bacterium]|nr:DUF3341 domain-containing protein [Deltaproteobacteria bacterium]
MRRDSHGVPGLRGSPRRGEQRRLMVAAFRSEDDVLAATREAREKGYEIVDVFTPYAVHGLDRAMGLRPSRLTFACFFFGLFGLVGALALQFWSSAVSWPINVGGKPWNSWPAFVPVAFELTVLCAGLGSVAALFWRARMFPGRAPCLSDPRVTNDHFVLVLAQSSAAFDADEVRRMLAPHDPALVHERVEDAP